MRPPSRFLWAHRFTGLQTGQSYTVREQQPAWRRFSSTPIEYAVVAVEGKVLQADFGDWNGRGVYMPLILQP